MENLSSGKFKTLNIFKNKYIGRRAFIIGNGPSLKKLDLTRLKNEITFGVNSIFYHFETMGFKPTFYVVEDTLVAEDRADEINNLTGMVKIFGTYLNYCLADGEDVIWANVIFDYTNYPGFPNFSRNAAESLWVGGTVSYLCMQLAYYMGFSEVYLVGFDHSYTIPKDAKIEGNVITSVADDSNHFHPEYFGKGKRWHDPKLDRMELAYKHAKEVFEQNGRIIYNATAGGKLEVFPRVDYGRLFAGQKDIPAVSSNRPCAVEEPSSGDTNSDDKVRISVVVCTHRNPTLLTQTLDSLTLQTLSKELYEVIVVDNNSQDNTKDVVDGYLSVRYVFEEKLGLSYTRNTGIDKAEGDVVAFIDDDAEADPDWVGALLKVYDTVPDAWAVGGRVLPIWDGERPEWLSDEFAPSLSIRDYGVASRPLDWPKEGMIGTNCSFRREVFSTFGNFDINLGRVGPFLFSFEEADLQRRISQAGHQIYHTNAIVFHHVPPSRMTREYLSKRALGNEVSKIFMDLRDTNRNGEVERFVDRARNVGSNLSNESALSAEEQILDDLYSMFVHKCPDITTEEKVGFVSVVADCYLEQGKYAKAERKCLEGLSFPSISDKLHRKLCLQLARVCLRRGKEGRTKQILLDVLRTGEIQGKEAYQLEGIIEEYCERQSQDSKIEDDFDEVLGSQNISEHNKSAILRCYSMFYINQGMYGQAEELYSKMFSSGNLKNSTTDKLLLGLGELYKKWGRLEQSREVLTKALFLEEAMANEKTEPQHVSGAARRPQVHSLGGDPDESHSSGRVRISVVVCTHRNRALLAKTLDSLGRQTLPQELFEVIVVDNNSQDNTKEVVARYPMVRYVLEERLGLSNARNTGVEKAQGDIIAFIDDDAEASPQWLQALLKIYDSIPDAWAVGGKVLPIWDSQKPAWLTQSYYRALSLVEWGEDVRTLCWPERIIGTNCSFRREVFSVVGHFVSELGRIANFTLCLEDTEIQQRIHKTGRLVYYTPDAAVYHHVPAHRMSREYINNIWLSNRLSEQIISLKALGKTKEVGQLMVQIRSSANIPACDAGSAEHRILVARLLSLAVIMQHPDDPKQLMDLIDGIFKRKDLVATETMLRACIGFYPTYEVKGYDFQFLMRKHRKWRELKDAFKGRRAFLIGNGPSLNKTPLYLLKDEFTLSFNRFNLMFERLSWKPTMYMVVDERVAQDNADDINEVAQLCRFVFVPDIHPGGVDFREFIKDADNVYWLTQDWSGFYQDLPHVGLGGTVANVGLQVLAFMGFSPIYLVGVDMDYVDHSTAIKHDTRDWTSTRDDDPNHFDPRYFGKGKKYHYPKLHENMLPSMKLAKEETEKAGVEIINAGIGGKLEVFPRVDFHSLFDYTKKEELDLFLESIGNLDISDDRSSLYGALPGTPIINSEAEFAEYTGKTCIVHTNIAKQLASQYIASHIPYGPIDDCYVLVSRQKHSVEIMNSQDKEDAGVVNKASQCSEIYTPPSIASQEKKGVPTTLISPFRGGTIEMKRFYDTYGSKPNRSSDRKAILPKIRENTNTLAPIPRDTGDMSVLARQFSSATAKKYPPSNNRVLDRYARNPSEMKWSEDKEDARIINEASRHTSDHTAQLTESERIDLLYDEIRANSSRLLMQYKDKYHGQRCVIMGNGPSLNNTDLSLLKNEYTFGLNKIYLLFDRIDWRPTFYVCVNPFVIQQSAHQILNDIPGLKFLDFVSLKYLPYNKDTVHLLSLNGKGFSTDPCEGVFQMHTVTYVAMQLAYYLGFDEVLLVGVDHFFNAVNSGQPDQMVVQNDYDTDHFDANYFGKGQEWNLPNLKGSEEGYRIAKATFEKADRKIYDATIGGHLTVFGKVDFYDVFGNTKNSYLHGCAH